MQPRRGLSHPPTKPGKASCALHDVRCAPRAWCTTAPRGLGRWAAPSPRVGAPAWLAALRHAAPPGQPQRRMPCKGRTHRDTPYGKVTVVRHAYCRCGGPVRLAAQAQWQAHSFAKRLYLPYCLCGCGDRREVSVLYGRHTHTRRGGQGLHQIILPRAGTARLAGVREARHVAAKRTRKGLRTVGCWLRVRRRAVHVEVNGQVW